MEDPECKCGARLEYDGSYDKDEKTIVQEFFCHECGRTYDKVYKFEELRES